MKSAKQQLDEIWEEELRMLGDGYAIYVNSDRQLNKTEALYRLGVLTRPRPIKEYLQETRECIAKARRKNCWLQK